MREVNYGGHMITERKLDNGWYELSALVYSMGEEYREHMRYDHRPTGVDYNNFLKRIEANR